MKKKIKFFEALSNFKVLKKDFEDLEFLVFRSGKNYYPPLIEYRLDIWKEKVGKLSRWAKFWYSKSLKDLETREVSIRSRLTTIEKIEKEIKGKE